MKLWLLQTTNGAGGWYDSADGFVVAAPDEATAREQAQAACGDEFRKGGSDFWYDPQKTTCVELRGKDYQAPAVILRDYNAG